MPTPEPAASRPYMPGYGIESAGDGSGLLPWSWAVEWLTASHDYWVTTIDPGGTPHVMPVWGVWLEDALWFSSGLRSRKVRNLRNQPRCAIATDNASQPVVLEGTAEIISEVDRIEIFLEHSNRKYDASYDMEFLNPEVNGTIRVHPSWAFGLDEEDFTGSATRWVFE